jgi:hypothetical protein
VEHEERIPVAGCLTFVGGWLVILAGAFWSTWWPVVAAISDDGAQRPFWLAVERASWLLGTVGVLFALGAGVWELRRIANELSRRPVLETGLLAHPVGPEGPELVQSMEVPATQLPRFKAEFVEVTITTTNSGRRSAKNVLLNYLVRDALKVIVPPTQEDRVKVERIVDGWMVRRWETAIHPGSNLGMMLRLVLEHDQPEIQLRVNLAYEDEWPQTTLMTVKVTW